MARRIHASSGPEPATRNLNSVPGNAVRICRAVSIKSVGRFLDCNRPTATRFTVARSVSDAGVQKSGSIAFGRTPTGLFDAKVWTWAATRELTAVITAFQSFAPT